MSAPQSPSDLPHPGTPDRPSPPPTVQRALTLLWFSWFLSFPQWALAAERHPDDGDLLTWLVNVLLLVWMAWLNHRVGRRGDAARWCLLGLTAMGWALQWWPPEGEAPPGLLETCLNASDCILSAWAMWLVFTGEGAAWFRRRPD